MKLKKIYLLALIFFTQFLYSQNKEKFYSFDFEKSFEEVEFKFKGSQGDRFRILTTVNEDVYYNRQFSHKAEIINRTSGEVLEVKEDGSCFISANFMTSENSTEEGGKNFTFGEEYSSEFLRSPLGIYTIEDNYFMPSVRNVPAFPNRKLKAGESWVARGNEVHDLRAIYKINKPYQVPFLADYKYLGKLKENGLHVFTIKYKMNFKSPVKTNVQGEYPLKITGFSDEIIYWDLEKGNMDHYTENFRILVETSHGNYFEYRGNSYGEILDYEKSATEENLNKIQNTVEELGIENVTVKNIEEGLTLSIENIKFKADSAELLESEKEKLEKIAEILKKFQNDILVSGHTALAGTEKVRQELSLERANAVADYLISLGVRDVHHIFTKGYGATRPIDTNETLEGKAKNRRVEITLLDK